MKILRYFLLLACVATPLTPSLAAHKPAWQEEHFQKFPAPGENPLPSSNQNQKRYTTKPPVLKMNASAYLRAYPHYIQEVTETELVWKDGTKMPLGTPLSHRSFEEKVMHPTLYDQLSIPYPQKPSYDPSKQPRRENDDPGRIRFPALFSKMYGATKEQVQAHLKELVWLPKTFGNTTYKLKATSINGARDKLGAISHELDELCACPAAQKLRELGKRVNQIAQKLHKSLVEDKTTLATWDSPSDVALPIKEIIHSLEFICAQLDDSSSFLELKTLGERMRKEIEQEMKELKPFKRAFQKGISPAPQNLLALSKVVKRLKEIAVELDIKTYLENPGGTFDWRPIAGTDRPSAHSFGMTLDINSSHSQYWLWDYNIERGLPPTTPALEEKIPPGDVPLYRNKIPLEIVRVFEKNHFIWGGKWFHYDTMHFEYRPELFY